MQFLFAPIMGGLSDKYGRRPVLLASLLGFGLDYVLLAFAPNYSWLFIGRIIAGAMGASFTTASAYIADISNAENRAQNFGMVGAAFGLGFIIGPAIGGLLGSYGARVPFLFAASLSLLNCLYGFFILPESLRQENRRAFDWKRANPVGSLLHLKKYPVIIGLVASLILIYIAAHAVQGNWSYYTIEKFHWSEKMIGLSLAVVGVLVAAVQGGLIRVVLPRWGQKKSLYTGLTLYSLGYLLFAFATHGWMMFVFLIPYCLGGPGRPRVAGHHFCAGAGQRTGRIARGAHQFGESDLHRRANHHVTIVWVLYRARCPCVLPRGAYGYGGHPHFHQPFARVAFVTLLWREQDNIGQLTAGLFSEFS